MCTLGVLGRRVRVPAVWFIGVLFTLVWTLLTGLEAAAQVQAGAEIPSPGWTSRLREPARLRAERRRGAPDPALLDARIRSAAEALGLGPGLSFGGGTGGSPSVIYGSGRNARASCRITGR
jgi:hypothetical protein